MKKSARISARITDDAQRKLKEIATVLDEDLSEAIMRSIEERYARIVADRQSPWRAFEGAGFIGGFPGDPDLSGSYKRELTIALDKKHDHR